MSKKIIIIEPDGHVAIFDDKEDMRAYLESKREAQFFRVGLCYPILQIKGSIAKIAAIHKKLFRFRGYLQNPQLDAATSN